MSASAPLNRKRPRRNRPTQAFYYYLSEVGKTMQQTVLDVLAYWKTLALPVRHLMYGIPSLRCLSRSRLRLSMLHSISPSLFLL